MTIQYLRQAGDEIEVTPEMVRVGSQLLWERELPPSREELPLLVKKLYRAMASVQLAQWNEVERLLNEDPASPK